MKHHPKFSLPYWFRFILWVGLNLVYWCVFILISIIIAILRFPISGRSIIKEIKKWNKLLTPKRLLTDATTTDQIVAIAVSLLSLIWPYLLYICVHISLIETRQNNQTRFLHPTYNRHRIFISDNSFSLFISQTDRGRHDICNTQDEDFTMKSFADLWIRSNVLDRWETRFVFLLFQDTFAIRACRQNQYQNQWGEIEYTRLLEFAGAKSMFHHKIS